jgi:hypothetical protein
MELPLWNEKRYAPYKLIALVEVLNEQGVPLEARLSGTGLSPESLAKPETLTSVRQYITVCHNALELSKTRETPFRTGSRIPLSAYGMYGFALVCSPTIREYFQVAVKYHRLATPLLSMSWREDGDYVSWVLPMQPSFLYFFVHGYPAEEAAGLHAFHASELPYVFGTFDATPPLWPKVPATPEETKLSDAMIGYWSSFVRTGRPQAANEPDWPAFGTTGAYIVFTDAPRPSDHLMPGMYELNEDVVCRRRASGDIPWGWNVGVVSPKIPPQTAQCKH